MRSSAKTLVEENPNKSLLIIRNPAGAEARPLLAVSCGTTEVVPFYKAQTFKGSQNLPHNASEGSQLPFLGSFHSMESGGTRLLLDFDSAPEGHVALDLTGRGLRIGVEPGGILVVLPVDP